MCKGYRQLRTPSIASSLLPMENQAGHLKKPAPNAHSATVAAGKQQVPAATNTTVH